MKKSFCGSLAGLAAAALLLHAPASMASSVVLGWTPPDEPGLASFRIYMADEEGEYHYRTGFIAEVPSDENQAEIELGNVSGEVLYFTITSVDSNGLESAPSEAAEVVCTGGDPSPRSGSGSGGCFIRSL